MRETQACLYATGGDLIETETDVCGTEIPPGLDP